MLKFKHSLLGRAKQAYAIHINNKPTGLMLWATDPQTARCIADKHLQTPYTLAPNPTATGTDLQTITLKTVST